MVIYFFHFVLFFSNPCGANPQVGVGAKYAAFMQHSASLCAAFMVEQTVIIRVL